MKIASKKIILLIAVFSLFFSVSSVSAEDNTSSGEYTKALGFSYCLGPAFVSGGLTYQQWIGDFSFHVDLDMTFDSEFAVLGGIQKSFYQAKHNEVLSSELFVWADAGLYITTDSGTEMTNCMAGAGIGFEIICFDHFSVPVKIGYTAVFPKDTTVSFSYSGGLLYRF